MMAAGAEVFRVNGAHAGPADVARWVKTVRRAAADAFPSTSVLVDLPGTKLRTGAFEAGPVTLRAGETARIFAGTSGGGPGRIPVHPFPSPKDVPVGAVVLLGDGEVRLAVVERRRDGLLARVVDGGEVATGKGVHLPGVGIAAPVPTDVDRDLARAAVEAGADYLGQSFVTTKEDVGRLKDLLAGVGAKAMPVVAKVESLAAVENLEGILERADAVVVARGDLGVDAGPERVPSLQKRILHAARRAGRPAVVATEMLESMTREMRPTRAEASDVAGAVFEGADAVMLSAETAVGAHPVLVVETMARILAEAEKDPDAPYAGDARLAPPESRQGRPDQHVVRAAVSLAEETGARAIVVVTRTGSSAVRLSKERPRAEVHAFAPADAVCRRLSLAWGVRARRLPGNAGTDAVARSVLATLREAGDLGPRDRAVLVMGGPGDPAGATTLIRLLTP
jgi:pyruvate kinase